MFSALTIALRLSILTLLLVAAPMRSRAGTGELTILTEDFPPVSFLADGVVSGLAVDVVAEIERRLGLSEPIQFVPWARGYHIALRDPNVVLFTVVRTPKREHLFKWVGPLLDLRTGFYARAGSGLRISSRDEAKALASIGVPRTYYTDEELTEAGFGNLDRVTSPRLTVKKLMSGRNTVIAADSLTLPYILQAEGVSQGEVELLYTFSVLEDYIAFSRGTPESTVSAWQKVLVEMKQDGALARIFAKWLPNEALPELH